MLGKTPWPPHGAFQQVSLLITIPFGCELTHDKTKTQRDSSPVFREEECISRLPQGARCIWLDKAIDANEYHDFRASVPFINPSPEEDLLDVHEIMPNMLVILRNRSGRKLSGSSTTPQTIFHWRMLNPGTRAYKLSAKSTTSATHAPKSSKQKRKLVIKRACCPKLM